MKCSNPSSLILVIWAYQTKARETLNRGSSTRFRPCCWASWITMGSELGSRKKPVVASLSPCRANSTGCIRLGWGARMSKMLWRVVAR